MLHTVGRERDRCSSIRHGRDLMDLEPHLTGTVERRSRARSFGHVNVEGTGVVDRLVQCKADGRACSHGSG